MHGFQIYDIYVENEEPTIYREDVHSIINETNDDATESHVQDPNISTIDESKGISEEIHIISVENPPTIAASRSPFTQQEQESSLNCPMQENLASCDIFLCRVFRNMLAMPFPDCYASRFRI